MRAPATGDPGLPDLDLHVDKTWLPHVSNLEALSGALLGGGLILAVGAIAVAALAWAASRALGMNLRSGLSKKMGAALIGAIALGSLAGIVGWGMGFNLST